VRAPDLLLAFEDAFHVDRQISLGLQVAFQCLDVGEQLSLIVGSATGVEIGALDRGAKRRCSPLTKRLTWEHVVVPVDQKSGAVGPTTPRGNHNRIAACRNHPNPLQSDALQMPRKPFRAFPDIRGTVRL